MGGPILPRHLYEGTVIRENAANNAPVGTGPFRFVEWRRGEYVHLVRNEDYWSEGRPRVDEIYFHFIPDSAQRVIAMETGRIDVARAREAGFLRLAVELEIVRRLAETRPAGLAAALHDGLAQMRELLASGDHVAFVAADEAFHFTLYAAAGVPGLHLLVRSRSGHLDRLRRLHLPTPGKADAVLRDHEQIAEAIIRAEPERAERHLRAHLSGTVAELDRIRAEAPEYF